MTITHTKKILIMLNKSISNPSLLTMTGNIDGKFNLHWKFMTSNSNNSFSKKKKLLFSQLQILLDLNKPCWEPSQSVFMTFMLIKPFFGHLAQEISWSESALKIKLQRKQHHDYYSLNNCPVIWRCIAIYVNYAMLALVP